jgi:hypothetical protein
MGDPMPDDASARTRQQGLQHAASVIFALVAIVPLLIFAWTLHALGAIRSPLAQISLALALAVALLGFWMFRSLLGRMAEVVQALTAAVEQSARAARRAAASPPTPRPPAASAPARVEVAAAPAAAPPPAPPSPATTAARTARGVAGIGQIRELTEVTRTMDALWYREASAHLNQRVQVFVANSREPLVGTLSEATADGLILEQPDRVIPIAYGRVTAIDRA